MRLCNKSQLNIPVKQHLLQPIKFIVTNCLGEKEPQRTYYNSARNLPWLEAFNYSLCQTFVC